MRKSNYPLKLPASVKAAAERLARVDGVSLNQFIAVAVAEKVGAMEAAPQFLAARAGDAKPEDLLPFLLDAKDELPVAGDQREAPTAGPRR